MAAIEAARARFRQFADYEAGLQYGPGRILLLVRPGAAAGLHQGHCKRLASILGRTRLGSSSIIVRMSAIRKLAVEATDNGLLAPELAAGIQRVKSAKSIGVRMGNWLSQKQAQAQLNTPDISTLKGLRDRAIIAVPLGCGLRRSEVAALTIPMVLLHSLLF